MSTGIQVGATREAIVAAREAILEILNAGRDEKTIRIALTAFVSVCEVKNTTITGCQITMLPEYDHEPESAGVTDD